MKVYLKPMGGLCNRMRAIDSMIDLSTKFQLNLIVLWTQDATLNCQFQQLFLMEPFLNEQVTILNCPAGFPELYGSVDAYQKLTDQPQSTGSYVSRALKNTFHRTKTALNLSKDLKNTVSELSGLSVEQILLNEELKSVYNSSRHIGELSVTDMDNLSYPGIESKISGLLQQGRPLFISTCYRVGPLQGNYGRFKPTETIAGRVERICNRFQETIGIHLRRTDHNTAIVHSPLEVAERLISEEMAKNGNATFYLATDDVTDRNSLVSKFGNRIFYQENKNFDRNSPKAIQAALVDLICLSRTVKVLGSHHSTFSQVAAQMGDILEQTIQQ